MVGRYAPSPTGDLHLGNLRTAVIARRRASRLILRVDDLDTGRVRPHFVERQLADLGAVGVTWEAVVTQSERTALYEAALERLDTYPCFCTRAEIREAPSAPHAPPGWYPGTCRDRTDRPDRPPALRVRSDDPAIDDFVVRRNDGAFAYNLASVVDDADLGVEEVVRGADLADTTPRQAWLARALGFEPPRYVHVGLVLGPDGARLAKRHGAITLRDIGPAEARAWIESTLAHPLDESVTFP